jgi:hypothetical protein
MIGTRAMLAGLTLYPGFGHLDVDSSFVIRISDFQK